MDPTLVVNIGLMLITAIGVVVAALQARDARKARDDAVNARDKAAEYEKRAVTASEVSAGAAQRSATALENTVAFTANQDARARERSDVEWDWRWDDTHVDHVVIQNIGKSQAVKTVIQFMFDDVTESNDDNPLDMAGREEIRLKVRGLAKRRRHAAINYEAQRRSGPYRPDLPVARTRLRVVWETPLGTVSRIDTGWRDKALFEHRTDLRNLVHHEPSAD